MFFTDAMIGSTDRIFYVADDGIEPPERPYLLRISAITGNESTMDMTTSLKGSETAKAVGNNNAAGVCLLAQAPQCQGSCRMN